MYQLELILFLIRCIDDRNVALNAVVFFRSFKLNRDLIII